MKTSSGTWIFGAALVLAVSLQAPCLAAEPGRAHGAGAVLDALAGRAVAPAALAGERARGLVLNEAVSTAAVIGNSVGSRTLTGAIGNSNSINNNVGLTTVFQNSGNNALLQSSTSIYISIR